MVKKWLILIVGIVLIGCFLRIYKISNQNFWIDESTAIQKSEKLPSFNELEQWAIHWMNPPFYNFIFHFWLRLFGQSEFAARALSAIFGVLTIILVYIVGMDLFNKKTALFSALIVAFSPFHIGYSQDAKMYALLSFLGLLSIYFLYKTLFSKKKFYWVIYFFVTTLLLYTHNWGIFLLISENIFCFLIMRRVWDKKKYLLSQVLICLFYLPWLPLLFKQILQVKYYVDNLFSSIYTLPMVFSAYAGKIIYFGESVMEIGAFPSVIGMSLYGVLFFLGLSIKEEGQMNKYFFWRSNPHFFLICCLFFSIIIPFLAAFKFAIFNVRYTIIVFPVFCIIIGCGLAKIKHIKLQMLVISILIFVSLFSLYKYYYYYVKSYDKSLTNYVMQNLKEDDLMVIAPRWIGVTFKQYSKNYKIPELDITELINPSRQKAEQLVEKIKNQKKTDTLILLYSEKINDTGLKHFKKYLDDNLYIDKEKDFRNKTIIFYKLK